MKERYEEERKGRISEGRIGDTKKRSCGKRKNNLKEDKGEELEEEEKEGGGGKQAERGR